MPTEIVDDVRAALMGVARAHGERAFLTAYQILSRLPVGIRDRIIRERTLGGEGAGAYYAAPSVVSDAAEMIGGIEIRWIERHGISITVAGQAVVPSNDLTAIYRLADPTAHVP